MTAASLATIVGLGGALSGPAAGAAPAQPTTSTAAASTTTGAAQSRVTGTCSPTIAGVGAGFRSRIDPNASQVVVVAGSAKTSSYNKIRFWQKQSPDCWVKVKTMRGRNGYTGWSKRPTDGSGLSPIGVFGLTDAGGRLPSPGTLLPYHYSPGTWDQYGYRMNDQKVQVFDYVVAVNFNRFVGTPPRDMGRPNPNIHDGGIWFHVSGAGATRGCVSVSEPEMIWVLRWLVPAQHPTIVMGPARSLAR